MGHGGLSKTLTWWVKEMNVLCIKMKIDADAVCGEALVKGKELRWNDMVLSKSEYHDAVWFTSDDAKK